MSDLTNSLFLDLEYKADCEKKIDYFTIMKDGITNENKNVVSSKTSVSSCFYKQISKNYYKLLNNSN